MLELLREYFTVEQIAERWAIDPVDVQQLILTRQLKQSFVIFGPATIYLPDEDGILSLHPLTERGSVPSCILVGSLSSSKDSHTWPLCQVSKVFDFLLHGVNQSALLKEVCSQARELDTGSLISFDKATTTILGQDAVKLASEALRETSLIPLETLLDFEGKNGINPQPADEPTLSNDNRDSARQRCRAIAQLLWEKDPAATVPDLFKSEWIQRIACEGRPPTERTFRDWVKDLNPDRRPGRRSR